VSYQDDALGRRVLETRAGVSTELYYSDSWQVLEERQGGPTPGRLQYAWSPVYVDALVARDTRDPNTGALLGRLYAVQDANWNVTAVINTSGQEVERYAYDPYGAVTVTHLLGPSTNWAYLFQGGRYDTASGLYDFRGPGVQSGVAAVDAERPARPRRGGRQPVSLRRGQPRE
jgi:YD repeat-containing protein